MSVETSNKCKTMGSVSTAGAMVSTGGDVASARTGAGVYTLTLSGGGLDATDCSITVTPRAAAARIYTVEHTSNTVKTIRTFNAAAAATDSAFDFMIWECPNGIKP